MCAYFLGSYLWGGGGPPEIQAPPSGLWLPLLELLSLGPPPPLPQAWPHRGGPGGLLSAPHPPPSLPPAFL